MCTLSSECHLWHLPKNVERKMKITNVLFAALRGRTAVLIGSLEYVNLAFLFWLVATLCDFLLSKLVGSETVNPKNVQCDCGRSLSPNIFPCGFISNSFYFHERAAFVMRKHIFIIRLPSFAVFKQTWAFPHHAISNQPYECGLTNAFRCSLCALNRPELQHVFHFIIFVLAHRFISFVIISSAGFSHRRARWNGRTLALSEMGQFSWHNQSIIMKRKKITVKHSAHFASWNVWECVLGLTYNLHRPSGEE